MAVPAVNLMLSPQQYLERDSESRQRHEFVRGMMLPKEDIRRKAGSIGKPGFFTDVWIAGPNGERLPPGEIGEMVAKGPTVMSGYWNMPEATAETIVNGELHTGDLGYVDEEGYFYIVDRATDMYRTGGENVYPAEVEKILVGHPKILGAGAVQHTSVL